MLSISNIAREDMIKHCKGCDRELPLSEYYKAGSTYQSLCKQCHNTKRIEYHKTHYQPHKKPIGFKALPEKTQEEVKNMLNRGFNCVEIERAFKDFDIKTLRAHNLRNWIKLGQLTREDANSNTQAAL